MSYYRHKGPWEIIREQNAHPYRITVGNWCAEGMPKIHDVRVQLGPHIRQTVTNNHDTGRKTLTFMFKKPEARDAAAEIIDAYGFERMNVFDTKHAEEFAA